MNGTVVGVAAAAFVGLVHPVTAFFKYDAQEPLEIKMTLRAGGDDEGPGTTVVFARELLDNAVGGPADVAQGLGDVIITHLHGRDVLEFKFPGGSERPLVVEYEAVRDFIIRTYLLVPFDDEGVDGAVDEAIAKIFEAAS